MKQLKIEGLSEWFVLHDTLDPTKDQPYPSSRVFAQESKGGKILIRVVSDTYRGGYLLNRNGFDLSELIDNNGNPFATNADCIQWFKDNTGKSKGSGSTSGLTAAQVQALIDQTNLGDLNNVNDTGSNTGQVLTKKSDGTYHFEDLNNSFKITISDETGTNGTGNTSPVNTSSNATPDIGDVLKEIYDDVEIYFTATAADWAAPSSVEVPRDLTTFADATTASDDATGAGGTSSTAARSDHKHAAQSPSTDVTNGANTIQVGADGLHYLGIDTLLADTVSPAADNNIGLIGTSQEMARQDHKHPAQGVSADANNIITVGTDGLHQLPLDNTGFTNNLTTTDNTLQEIADKFDAYNGNPRLFADDTTVSPAIAGSPTVVEIATFAGTNRDSIIYYTGTDTSTDTPTYVYHIDASGNVTLFKEPADADKPTFAATVATGVDISPDFDVNQEFTLIFNGTSTGDINFQNSSTTNLETAEKVRITINNIDTVARNLVFGNKFLNSENSALGAVELPVGVQFRTLEFVKFGADSWVLAFDSLSKEEGLRGEPVADNTALTAISARDYERRKVLADGKEYVFELGAVSGTLADDLTTGFWQEQPALVAGLDDVLAEDQDLTQNRTVGLGGNTLTVGGAVVTNGGYLEARQLRLTSVSQSFASANPTYTPSPNAGRVELSTATGFSGTLTIGSPGVIVSGYDTEQTELQLRFANDDIVAGSNISLDAIFENTDNTPFGDFIVPFNGHRELHFKIVGYAPTNRTWVLTFDSEANNSSELTTNYIDSSAGVITENLAASTASGLVKLFTNTDVTNTATLAVQAGETLNGATDGTFLFSNYSAGTQFRADEVNGGWVVSVVGASTQTDLAFASMTCTANASVGAVASSQGGHYTFDLDDPDFTQVSSSNITVDTNDNVFVIEQAGRYDISYHAFFGGGVPTGIFVNGVEVARGTIPSSATRASNSVIRDLSVGDKIDFDISSGAVASATNAPAIKIVQLPTTESVLAGMVTPEDQETLLLEVDGVQNGNAYTGMPFPWSELEARGYKYIRVVLENPIASGFPINARLFPTENWGVNPYLTFTGDNTDWCRIRNIGGVTTGFFFEEFGAGFDTVNVKVYGVKSQKTVVMPDALEVENVGFFRVAANANNSTHQGPGNLPMVIDNPAVEENTGGIATYNAGQITITAGEYPVELKAHIVTVGNQTGPVTQEYFFRDINDATDVLFGTGTVDASSERGIFGDQSTMEPATARIPANTTVTLDVRQLNSQNFQTIQAESYIEAREVRPQQTVINTTDTPVDDQATSGYMDIGAMRVQWGTLTLSGVTTVTLPTPYADNSYSLVVQPTSGLAQAQSRAYCGSTKTATSFSGGVTNGTNYISLQCSWQAIGLKP